MFGKKPYQFIIVGFVLVILFMAGCKKETEDNSFVIAEQNGGVQAALLPCTDQSAPTIISPKNEVVDPSPPHTFVWEIDCLPKSSVLIVSERGDYTQIEDPVIFPGMYALGPGITEYTSDVPLEPATTYKWYLGIQDSPWSDSAVFTTGPICGKNSLVAPNLISPPNGSSVAGKDWGDNTEVPLEIEYPSDSCIPEEFVIFVSTTPDFSGKNWNAYSPGPSYYIKADGIKVVQDDTNSLDDCTIYFWRAWAIVGNKDGPVSETFSFFTNFEGTCPILNIAPGPGPLVISSAGLGWPEEAANGCVDKLPPPTISLCLKNEGDEPVDVGQLNFLAPLFLPDQHPPDSGMPGAEDLADLASKGIIIIFGMPGVGGPDSLGMGEGMMPYSGEGGFGPGVYYQGSQGLANLGFPSELGPGEEFCVEFDLSQLAAIFDPTSQGPTYSTELMSMNLSGPGLGLQIPASSNEDVQPSMFIAKAEELPIICVATPTVIYPTWTSPPRCRGNLNKNKCEKAGGSWEQPALGVPYSCVCP